MYKLLPLLGDVGLGILVIIGVSVYLGAHDPYVWFLFPLALLPDVDAVPELVKRGKVAADAEHPHDHREFLHLPIVWVLAALALMYVSPLYGTVALCLVLGHFLHDSVLTGWGVPWLWPVSSVRIKFLVNERNEESLHPKDWLRVWDSDELRRAIELHGDGDWIRHLYLRPTLVSVIEYGVFLCALIALIWYLR
jgi:hypothetical protein